MENREFEAKESKAFKPIPTGDYTGVITKIEYRDVPFNGKVINYADLIISLDQIPDTTIVHGLGCSEITPTTSLGKLMMSFEPFVVGQKINPSKTLIGKKISFSVVNIPGKKDPSKKYPQISKTTVAALK